MDRSKIIGEKRDTARRTRRMARTLSSADDRENLLRFAQELEDEAARLEQEAGDSASQGDRDKLAP